MRTSFVMSTRASNIVETLWKFIFDTFVIDCVLSINRTIHTFNPSVRVQGIISENTKDHCLDFRCNSAFEKKMISF